MPPACKYCGQPTVVDAAGVVCTVCAELAEPTLIVLTSDMDYPAPTTYDGWNPVSLKTIKTGRNRYLTGQGKEARDNRNLDDMHWYIKNLARAAFVSGTTERAYTLFEQAIKSGQYRWGRTAKLVAAACISIALRESNRPEMFPDLALLLGRKITSLTRAFSSVVLVLKLKLPSSEPIAHVSALQAHLCAALQGSGQSDLSPSVIAAIKSLPTSAVLATATSLSDLLAASDPPSALARLPASPTACAVLIWAIEAEARATLAQLSDLAAFLGSKCNVRKPVVMSRYKVIQDELIERIDKIDWLDHYEPNSGKNGRAKLSRRAVVARGLKAVIESERACRQDALNAGRPAEPDLEGGDSDTDTAQSRPRKRRRLHALQEATQFLLNPLEGSLPASFFPSSSSTFHSHSLPLPTYLLTSSLPMRYDKLPSRLQLLSVTRGGVGPDEIRDDELFDDGELDQIMRNEDQITELRNILRWDESIDEVQRKDPPKSRKRRAKAPNTETPTSSRLISEAVASYFAEDKSDFGLGGLLHLDADDPTFIIADNGDSTDAFIGLRRTLIPEEDDCLFSRSPSPADLEDRYTQEYD
ncbi:hypothetical protein B0H15DRAFT_928396 [Mycena belliarum]|uniref:Uncharacterized protein n=1 Tax=Mycena belliarum TaxID=1033014 RepID=A0AAD6XV57_9AGAR|nr:hypothetical protein B0H15DRAFT_928396 [Mycena belliae]